MNIALNYLMNPNPTEEERIEAEEYLRESIRQGDPGNWDKYYLYLVVKDKEEKRQLLEEIYEEGKEVNEPRYYLIVLELGKFYREEGDSKKAYEYLKKGIEETRYTDFLIQMGLLYENGLYVKKDYDKAYQYYLAALDMSFDYPDVFVNGRDGRAEALGRLAVCFLYGHGVRNDIHKALEYFEDANDLAPHVLNGMKEDYESALRWKRMNEELNRMED